MKTVVGLFTDTYDADQAVNALRDAGFSNADFSILAQDTVLDQDSINETYTDRTGDVGPGEGAGVGAAGGAVVGGLTGLLMGVGALAIPGIGPAIAVGSLATALTSAAAGATVGAVTGAVTGGVVAALVDLGIPEEDAHFYAEGVKRGGVLVTVNADDTRAATAEAIMRNSDAVEVDAHRENWRSQGWDSRFDDSAYSSSTYRF